MLFPLVGGGVWSWERVEDHDVFDLSELTPARLAHGLARVNRFCGATVNAFSVAEHSVCLARMTASPLSALAALLHDASEALGCADAHGKLKKALCPQIRVFESRLCSAVWEQLVGGPGAPDWSGLKPWDQMLGDWEAKCFGFPNEYVRPGGFGPPPECWDAGKAENEWLYEWKRNGGKL